MKCTNCDRPVLSDDHDVYCHECYTSLNDEHDKVRAVHSSLDELAVLEQKMRMHAAFDSPSVNVMENFANQLAAIIDRNKEAWGL